MIDAARSAINPATHESKNVPVILQHKPALRYDRDGLIPRSSMLRLQNSYVPKNVTVPGKDPSIAASIPP